MKRDDEKTLIQVDKKLAKKLKACKITNNESYTSIINRLMKNKTKEPKIDLEELSDFVAKKMEANGFYLKLEHPKKK